MATESPLIAHTHCTASANMSAGSGLAGPNGSGQFLFVSLSGSLTVDIATSAVDDDILSIHGILQNDPRQGQPANVGIFGISKCVAGATFSAGTGIVNDSLGRAVPCVNSTPFAGCSIEDADAVNQIIAVILNGNMVSSSDDSI